MLAVKENVGKSQATAKAAAAQHQAAMTRAEAALAVAQQNLAQALRMLEHERRPWWVRLGLVLKG